MDEPDETDENRRAVRPGAAVDEATVPSETTEPGVVPEADAFRFDPVDELDPVPRPDRPVLGPRTRRNLALTFDAWGVEIAAPGDADRQRIPWSDVDRFSCGAATVGPDGRAETIVDLELASGPVRYAIRSDGPLAVATSALEIQVGRWTAAGRADPDPGTRAAGSAAFPPSTGWTSPPVPTARPSVPFPYPAPAPWYAPPAPYTFDTSAPLRPYDPFDPYGANPSPAPAVGRKRTRRTVTLVVALVLVASGVGLAVGLSAVRSTPPPARVVTGPAPSPDERLAQELLLTKGDLPVGWRVSTNPGTAANSPALQQGEARITHTLAQCMGITDAEGAIVLGGAASDQTAQLTSPIFVAPTSATIQTAVELQTAATVVRTHQDEQQDFALFTNPKYPQCAATASADELQLGVNQTSGGGDQAGPATAAPLAAPSTPGVQLSGLLMTFTVVDGTATVPVQVESITLGAHRIEAGLEVFAIGGQIPSQSLATSISTFERRVASGGASSVV